MTLEVLHQSAATGGSNRWQTPPEVFDALHAEFGFGLDACATPGDQRLAPYIDPETDALRASWGALSGGAPVWMNPPYGRLLHRWTAKAYAESRKVPVVGLILNNTETVYWRDHVWRASEVRFIVGRVYFIAAHDIYTKTGRLTLRRGERGPATKGAVIAVWRPGHDGPPRTSLYEQGDRGPLPRPRRD